MTPPDPNRYTLTELSAVAGVTPRTIRYYLAQGLLPSPGGSGPGAKYDEGHLSRLRLVRKLQREHLPLAEIRGRLAELDDATIQSLAEEPVETPDPQDSALDYVRRVLGPKTPVAPGMIHRRPFAVAESPMPLRALAAIPPLGGPAAVRPPAHLGVEQPRRFERSQWERIPLAPDIELHVRRPLPRPVAKQVDRLVSIARDLLEEDPS